MINFKVCACALIGLFMVSEVFASEVTLIHDIKPGETNYNSLKLHKQKRMAANSKICSEQKNYSVLRVMCYNDRVLDLEEELLITKGLDPVKNSCINNCTLYRTRLENCLKERYELQCMENFFSVEIANEQIKKNIIPVQKVNYNCSDNTKISAAYYGSELPAVIVSYAKKDYFLYKFPQNKGKYFSEALDGCISCKSNIFWTETDNGIEFKTQNLSLSCDKLTSKNNKISPKK
jgi:hypothetical protein